MKITTRHFNSLLNPNTIGDEKWWTGIVIPFGWISQTGSLIKRIDYKELFDFAVSNGLIVTEEKWQNEKLFALFSYGTDNTNFRIPDKRGLSYVGFEDGYHNKLGQYQQDQIVNITGAILSVCDTTGTAPYGQGAFYQSWRGGAGYAGGGGRNDRASLSMDSSRVVKTGERVQTRSITAQRIIKYR